MLEDGLSLARSGGIVSTNWDRGIFGEMLGCELDEFGGIVVDELSRTNIEGVYAAGDVSHGTIKQVVIAASEGSRAAIRVFSDLLEEEF
ncbi:Thioredoxin reductase [compost metagenome]